VFQKRLEGCPVVGRREDTGSRYVFPLYGYLRVMFIGSAISGINIEVLSKTLLPFYGIMLLVLMRQPVSPQPPGNSPGLCLNHVGIKKRTGYF
jgi:hypothetical protein